MTLVKKKKKRRSRTHRVSRFHRSRNYLRFCLFLVLATALTWGVGLLDKHHVVSQQDGLGQVFPSQADAWTLVGDQSLIAPEADTFIISPKTEFHTRAELSLSLSKLSIPNEKTIRIRTVTKTLERPSLEGPRAIAGILVKGFNRHGKRIYNGWVSKLTGEFGTHRDEYMIPVSNSLDSIRLSFVNRGSNGRFQLQSMDIEVVKVSPMYKMLWLPALLAMWAVLMALCVRHTLLKLSRRTVLFFVGAIFVLVAGILLPTSLRDLFVQPVFNQLKAIGLTSANLSLVHYYKIGHFLMFFVVSLILFYNSKRLRIRRADLFGILCVLAIATEGAQLHLFFRSTQLQDIAIDIAGITMALLISLAIMKDKKKGKKKRSSTSASEATSDTDADADAQTPTAEAKSQSSQLSDNVKEGHIDDDEEQNLDTLRSRLKNEFKHRRQGAD